MGRSKKGTQLGKGVDLGQVESILSSSSPREVKLRKLSQIQNGNRKLGTMQAKIMLDNFNNKKDSTFMDNMLSSLDDNTRKTLEDLKKDMDSDELKQFNGMDRSQFIDLMKSFQERTG